MFPKKICFLQNVKNSFGKGTLSIKLYMIQMNYIVWKYSACPLIITTVKVKGKRLGTGSCTISL